MFDFYQLEDKGYSPFTQDELRFASPEVLANIGNSDTTDLDGQLWWDLGIILYELCAGNRGPFTNKSYKASMALIQRYEAAFPVNLPYSVSEPLKSLIRELLTKNKYERLGYVDQGGAEDILM